MYDAAGWHALGETKGCSRQGNSYTEAHEKIKRILVRPLRRDARRMLCNQGELDDRWQKKCEQSGHSLPVLRSLYEELSQMRDFRRAQGRKHTLARVFSVLILAKMLNFFGSLAATQFAKSLSQQELEASGAWRNSKSGRSEPSLKSTLHRVIQNTDSEQFKVVLSQYSGIRNKNLTTIAADGKRILGANHNATVTMRR